MLVPTELDRRALLRTVARIGLLAVLALVGYFTAPLTSTSDTPLVLPVLAGIGTVVLIGLQSRAVVRSATPILRAAEAVSVSVIVVLVVFAAIHVSLSRSDPAAFSEPLDHVDGLYLSMMTMTTIGFGDIGTVSSSARIAVMAHMFVTVVVLGVAIRFVLSHARDRVARGDHGDLRRPTAGET